MALRATLATTQEILKKTQRLMIFFFFFFGDSQHVVCFGGSKSEVRVQIELKNCN